MEKYMKKILLAAVALGLAIAPAYAARDQIRIVGSSTVYPFTTAVAEAFGKKTGAKTPIVESTGTGGGFKLFCAGRGENHPDATNASRAIKEGEAEDCKKNGVTPVEVEVGIDAIVLAMSTSNDDMSITTEMLYRALAKWVIIDGKVVVNPYKTWADVDSSLPANKIEVLGPPPTSGTRDSFVELVLEKECKAAIKSNNLTLTDDEEKTICKAMREDGPFIEAGENDNIIVQKIQSNPNAFGIFGYSFLDENRRTLKGVTINGVVPDYDGILSGNYAIARPLFIYFKEEHFNLVPNLREFMEEYQSENAIGEEGYLTEKGLISIQ
jgi:phosphate transport system substrate-binding protein